MGHDGVLIQRLKHGKKDMLSEATTGEGAGAPKLNDHGTEAVFF